MEKNKRGGEGRKCKEEEEKAEEWLDLDLDVDVDEVRSIDSCAAAEESIPSTENSIQCTM